MEEHIGTITLLAAIGSGLAEQLGGSRWHGWRMAWLALLTTMGVVYAAKLLGTTVAAFGLKFEALEPIPLTVSWAYGLFVYAVASKGREAVKALWPGVASPSFRVGSLLWDSVPMLKDKSVLPADDVQPGDNLRDKENPNIIATVTSVFEDKLVVIINGATHTLPRSRFRWLNAPRR